MQSLANINHVRVRNMDSPRSGRPVANQFIVDTAEGTYFQSYDSVIAFVPKDREAAFYKFNKGSLQDHKLSDYPEVYLDTVTWNYSVTTSKYRNEFLHETTKDTKQAIKNKRYFLIDLNGGTE